MKKLGILLLLAMFSLYSFGQKTAFINTDTIFSKLPQMQEAQKKLGDFLKQVQTELNDMQKEYQQKVSDYQNSKDTLDKFIADKKLEEIKDLDKKIQNFKVQAQTQYLQMQKELLNPIEENFKKAVEKVAKKKGYTSVIQITPQIIYYDKKYDITDLVLKEMGVNSKK